MAMGSGRWLSGPAVRGRGAVSTRRPVRGCRATVAVLRRRRGKSRALLAVRDRASADHGSQVLRQLFRALLRWLQDGDVWGDPDPLAVGPEPEQGPQASAHDQGDVVPDLAFTLAGQVRQADAAVVDEQADPVQHEKDDRVPGGALALAVLEGPVPVAQERESSCQDRGDRDGFVLADAVQGVGHAKRNDGTDCPDYQELAALMDQVTESLVEPANAAHLWIPPPARPRLSVTLCESTAPPLMACPTGRPNHHVRPRYSFGTDRPSG